MSDSLATVVRENSVRLQKQPDTVRLRDISFVDEFPLADTEGLKGFSIRNYCGPQAWISVTHDCGRAYRSKS